MLPERPPQTPSRETAASVRVALVARSSRNRILNQFDRGINEAFTLGPRRY